VQTLKTQRECQKTSTQRRQHPVITILHRFSHPADDRSSGCHHIESNSMGNLNRNTLDLNQS